MGYEISRLTAKHKQLVNLVLEGRYNQRDMAKIVDLTPVAVGYVVNSGVFQQELARRREKLDKQEDFRIANGLSLARDVLEREALPSVLTIAELRDSAPDPNIRRQCANDLLKQAFARENAQAGAGLTAQIVMLQADKMAFFKQVLKESGIERTIDQPVAGTSPDASGTADDQGTCQEEPVLLCEGDPGVRLASASCPPEALRDTTGLQEQQASPSHPTPQLAEIDSLLDSLSNLAGHK